MAHLFLGVLVEQFGDCDFLPLAFALAEVAPDFRSTYNNLLVLEARDLLEWFLSPDRDVHYLEIQRIILLVVIVGIDDGLAVLSLNFSALLLITKIALGLALGGELNKVHFDRSVGFGVDDVRLDHVGRSHVDGLQLI